MKKWRIRTKKDWGIAFGFTALLVYAVIGRFSQRINRVLLYVTDPRLSDLNQPVSYGNVALTALVMGVLAGAVLLVKKKAKKQVILCFAAGCLTAAVSLGAYFFHCSLLVNVPGRMEPVSIWVYSDRGTNENWNGTYDPGDELQARFLERCTSLEELPKDGQARERALFEEKEKEGAGEEIRIWIRYPRKYLHSYSLLLTVRDGQVFIRRDGGKNTVFFKENGLKEAAEELLGRNSFS